MNDIFLADQPTSNYIQLAPGPRGGKRWQHKTTGHIVYSSHDPGSVRARMVSKEEFAHAIGSSTDPQHLSAAHALHKELVARAMQRKDPVHLKALDSHGHDLDYENMVHGDNSVHVKPVSTVQPQKTAAPRAVASKDGPYGKQSAESYSYTPGEKPPAYNEFSKALAGGIREVGNPSYGNDSRGELPKIYEALKKDRGGKYSVGQFIRDIHGLVRSDENLGSKTPFRLEPAVIENVKTSKSMFVPRDLKNPQGEGMWFQAVVGGPPRDVVLAQAEQEAYQEFLEEIGSIFSSYAPSLALAALEEVGIALSEKDWLYQEGPKGGHKWINKLTKRVVYSRENPDAHQAHTMEFADYFHKVGGDTNNKQSIRSLLKHHHGAVKDAIDEGQDVNSEALAVHGDLQKLWESRQRIRDWQQGKRSLITSPPTQQPPQATLTPESVSKSVLEIAESAPQTQSSAGLHGGTAQRGARFGDNKVLIGHVADEFLKRNPGVTRDQFNGALIAANRAGLIQLSRHDMAVIHPEDSDNSQIALHPQTLQPIPHGQHTSAELHKTQINPAATFHTILVPDSARLSNDIFLAAEDWLPQEGPKGGHRWINKSTGHVVYSRENPGGHQAHTMALDTYFQRLGGTTGDASLDSIRTAHRHGIQQALHEGKEVHPDALAFHQASLVDPRKVREGPAEFVHAYQFWDKDGKRHVHDTYLQQGKFGVRTVHRWITKDDEGNIAANGHWGDKRTVKKEEQAFREHAHQESPQETPLPKLEPEQPAIELPQPEVPHSPVVGSEKKGDIVSDFPDSVASALYIRSRISKAKTLGEKINAAADADTRIFDPLFASGEAVKAGIIHNEALRVLDQRYHILKRADAGEKRINESMNGTRDVIKDRLEGLRRAGKSAEADWYQKYALPLVEEARNDLLGKQASLSQDDLVLDAQDWQQYTGPEGGTYWVHKGNDPKNPKARVYGKQNPGHSDAERSRISEASSKEMASADHPLVRHKGRLESATFRQGTPAIKTIRSTKDAQLTAEEHRLMAAHHARTARIHDLGGRKDESQAHLLASQYHSSLWKSKAATPENNPKVVVADPGESQEIDNHLGRKLTGSVVSDLTGAHHGGETHVGFMQKGSLALQTKTDKYSSSRYLNRDGDGNLYIDNSEFFVNPEHQGNGLGTSVFARQVEGASKLGVKYISTYAAGNSRDSTMNGYYTWPLLGYDGEIGKRHTDKLPDQYKGAKTIQGLLAMPGGREAWKKHGSSIELKFDLSPNSASRRILSSYLARKKDKKTNA